MSQADTLRIAIRAFGPFERAIERQYASFQAATGCPLLLEWQALDLGPLYATLFTDEGLKHGDWDIAFVVTDWLAEAIDANALADLTPHMKAQPIAEYPQAWAPALTRMQQVGDAVYGVPYHDGPQCCIYRRDLFEDPTEQATFLTRYSYPLAPPRSWGEFVDIARFFNRPEQGLAGTVFAAFPDGHNTVYDFCLQLWSRGGDLTDASGAVQLDTPEAATALDFYRQIVSDRTATPDGQQEIDSVQSGARFAEGGVAMMVNWFGFAAVCEQPNSPTKGRVAVAPLPAGENGQSAALSVYWLLAIGAGSRHTDAAYQFLRYVCSAEMDKLATLEGAIGCRRSTWDDAEVNTVIPFYHTLAELHQHTRELPRSRELPRLIHVIDHMVRQALESSTPSATLLREAQREAATIQL